MNSVGYSSHISDAIMNQYYEIQNALSASAVIQSTLVFFSVCFHKVISNRELILVSTKISIVSLSGAYLSLDQPMQL